ncbi:glycoside hydrolase family 25 protein [Algoriphagus sp. CAU 1675]|uniref:glycoside hydrolase family 25 protein n=1 Tax=Algoriphagus sp. CAU 1675 TaxID=3032597 RepID=UPI0023DCB3B7|nr:glycoside hydrolase family 25 protein [Algoriphagus sp. CAU 1675]MDF2156795.1 glycoside hydrolase family 25 protein [Algoriphagus sp. CAU 1675]
MPRKKASNSWIWVIFLILLTLIGGTIFLVKYSKWIKRELSDYTRKTPPWTETLKFEQVFNHFQNGILGVDISQYQGKIDFKKLSLQIKNHPIQFLVFRATMGDDGLDRRFKENWEASKNLPVVRGVYHYYRPNENSTRQAENFIQTVKLESGDLIPVLDIEKHSTIQSRERLRQGIKNWLNLVEAHYAVKPMIYTGDRFFWEVLHNQGFDEYPIWVANYNRVLEPETKNWVIWQFSEKGSIEGIGERIDLNILRGGRFQFHKLKMP